MAELPNRDELEARLANKLGRLGARHRRELLALLGDPPDVTKVPESFWQKVEKETDDELAAVLLLIFMSSAIQHGMTQIEAELAAEGWAGNLQFGKLWVDGSLTKLETLGSRWQTATEAGEDLTYRSDTLEVFGPDRAETAGITETSRAQHDGAETAIESLTIEVVRIWRHSRFSPRGHAGAAVDPCKICTPRLDTPESEWGIYEPGICHVRCDCYSEIVDAASGRVLFHT